MKSFGLVAIAALICCSQQTIGQASSSRGSRGQANGAATSLRVNLDHNPLVPPVLSFVGSGLLAFSGHRDPINSATIGGSISLYNTRTGEVTGSIDWTAPSALPNFQQSPEVIPLADNRFLVTEAQTLRLFSSNGVEMASRKLPIKGVPTRYDPKLILWDRWVVAGSADGRSVLATKIDAVSEQPEEHWISIDTLQDVSVESPNDTGHCCHSISADFVIYRSSAPGLNPVVIRKRNEKPRSLCKTCVGTNPTFLDGRQVAIASFPATLLLVTTDGAVRKKARLGSANERIDQITVTNDGTRLAVLISPEYSGSGGNRVLVIDSATGKTLKRIDIQAANSQEVVGRFELASKIAPFVSLSPNGDEVAVLNASSLVVYKVDVRSKSSN